MIAHASGGQIEAISEVVLNLLKGDILFTRSSFKSLKPNQNSKSEKEKEFLNQPGRFLPALASLIAPLTLDLLGKVIK